MRLDFLLGFMAEGLLILIAAKLVRDLVLKARGYQVNQLIVAGKSIGAATTQAGYLVGVLLGFLGAITVKQPDPSFLDIAAAVALAGLVAIALQLVADLLSDMLIFRGVQAPKGAVEDANTALAVGKAAVSIATGLVLRGALSDPEVGLLARIGWFAVAQLAMVLAVLLYTRLTPYDDLGEIKRQNLAAGFPIAGILLAVGLLMEAAVSATTRSAGSTGAAALEAARTLGVGLVVIYVFRLIAVLVMLPRLKLSAAIAKDGNVAAGLQEGLSFYLAALITTYFMT
jgi:uncharacterized membrane protein YjfL (UPF0719 family)